MRFITQAHRIKYGIAICVTFTPDEKHDLFAARLSCTRQTDPVWHNSDLKPNRRYARRDELWLQKDISGCEFAESAGQQMF